MAVASVIATSASPVDARSDAEAPVVSEQSAVRASASLGYTPLNPERVLDTREGVGASRSKLGANDFLSLSPLSRTGIPSAGVDSVVLNVTAVAPTAPISFLTVWPRGGTRPDASSLNFVAGQTVPNLVIAKLGDNGQINIYNASGEVHVLADIVGYYADTSDFTGLAPARMLDTRRGVGAPEAPVGPGASIDLQVTGRLGVPTDDVGAVVLNVTATRSTRSSFVTVWPSGGDQPDASNVNFRAGTNVPNLVIVKVGAGGKVSLANEFGDVDLLADVVGYFLDGASYVGVTPSRILNTRDGTGAPVGKIGGGGQIKLDVLGVGGIPASDVRAVVLNMTAAAPTGRSFLTVWPGGDVKPTASSLNMRANRNVANLVIAKVGLDGTVMIENESGRTHVIADVVGYIDAAAGNELPAGLTVPATNEWSSATWTVNDATLREQDRTSGTFTENRFDTPFILDMRIRVTNNAVDTQRFPATAFAIGTDDGLLPSIDRSFFSTLSVAANGSEDIEMSFAVGWVDDLSGLSLSFGGVEFEPGEVSLVGTQTPPRAPVDVGSPISGVSVNGVCTNGSSTVQFSASSATWTTAIPPSVDTNGIGSGPYQADVGTRWLEIVLDLDGSQCSSANVNDGEFQLDVDSAFVESATFVNELLGTAFATNLRVTLVYSVPLDATNVSFNVDGASRIPISVANL